MLQNVTMKKALVASVEAIVNTVTTKINVHMCKYFN